MSPAWPVQVVPRLAPEHFPDGRLTVAVFGPGEGEAIVVALPDGRLGVLDGCAEREDPVAALLEEIDRARGDGWRFAFMGLTHPHDDHYAGLGHLLERYHDRIDQWWEPPLGERGVKTLLKLWDVKKKGRKAYWRNADLDSLSRVMRATERAAIERGKAYRIPTMDVRLNRIGLADGSHLTVTAVGPAPADVHRATQGLAVAARSLGEGRDQPSFGIDPNYTSAAVLIRWEEAGVLLGGDLLGDEEGHLGWGAARDAFAFDDGPVQVVKCAHHASAGAHDAELWSKLCPKLALVTPFKRAMTTRDSRENPPRPSQIAHLVGTGCEVVITSPPLWPLDPAHPRRQGAGRPATSPTAPTDAGARNDVLPLAPRAGLGARSNAVAVTLDAKGAILQVVLAGEADFYA